MPTNTMSQHFYESMQIKPLKPLNKFDLYSKGLFNETYESQTENRQ